MMIAESCGKKRMFPYASNVLDGNRESFGMAVTALLEPKRRKLRTGEPKACKNLVQKTWEVKVSIKKRMS